MCLKFRGVAHSEIMLGRLITTVQRTFDAGKLRIMYNGDSESKRLIILISHLRFQFS